MRVQDFPPSPYLDGRFTNGPVFTEVATSLLGVELMSYATGGATVSRSLVSSSNVDVSAPPYPASKTLPSGSEVVVPVPTVEEQVEFFLEEVS